MKVGGTTHIIHRSCAGAQVNRAAGFLISAARAGRPKIARVKVAITGRPDKAPDACSCVLVRVCVWPETLIDWGAIDCVRFSVRLTLALYLRLICSY